MTRREFMAAATAFAVASGCNLEQAMAQTKFRLRKAPSVVDSGSQVNLALSNVSNLGFIRFPLSTSGTGDLSGAFFSPAVRMVGGNTRILGLGDRTSYSQPLLEFDVTGITPSLVWASAPRANFVASHGPGELNALVGSFFGGAGYYPGGLAYDATHDTAWITVGDGYGVDGAYKPSLAAYKFTNDTWYGPWHFDTVHGRSRGCVGNLPAWFRSAYGGTEDMFVSASQASGAANSPFGVNGHIWTSFDPASKVASTVSVPSVVSTRQIIYHDLTQPQARDNNYKECGWTVAYVCSSGSTLTRGIPYWGHADQGGSTTDTYMSGVFVDTPGLKGYMALCQLAGTYADQPAAYDSDGLHHCGYGDAGNSNPYGFNYCCHGGQDAYWNTTGPFAVGKIHRLMRYDPAGFASVLSSATPGYGLTPEENIEIRTITGGSVFDRSSIPHSPYAGLSAIDNTNKKIYMVGGSSLGIDNFDSWPAGGWPVFIVLGLSA